MLSYLFSHWSLNKSNRAICFCTSMAEVGDQNSALLVEVASDGHLIEQSSQLLIDYVI